MLHRLATGYWARPTPYPRELLYDLWGLAQLGEVTRDSAELFARFGPTSVPPRPWLFQDVPDARAWETQLSAQTRIAVGPDDALEEVRNAWKRATRGDHVV